jgi:hypothetical protein
MHHAETGADVSRSMSKFGAALVILVAGCATGVASPAVPSTPTLTTLAASPTPILTPQSTLFGEFPGPGATVPPGQPVLENVRFEALAALWASLGLSCLSHRSGGPESPATYTVHCERRDAATNVEVVADADYWTMDALATLSVSVGSITMDGSVDHEATASDWVFPFAALAGGDAAVTWVKKQLDNSACRLGCSEAMGNGDLAYYNGSRGGQGLLFVVRIPVQSGSLTPTRHVTFPDAD